MASEASSSSSSLPSPTQRRVAAAEVWKDISLNSLNNRDTPSKPDPLFLRCFLISCSDARPASDSADAGNVSAAVDPRKERMIKNRESAARSRARKQAYTNELEKEVDHLLKENRRLKMKYEEVVG
ncbi:bZIP transcription factor 27-like isoform X2 [Zingiber officinale]|uniref:bZIP transcription factor 27-like isoform X2 n=1 Tax=Zingiber officinale TaxID=94328 RepID=UPI001C4AD2BA|nr:bZIP transcription factor 27-like isoform X2 [Zingiber officinale]